METDATRPHASPPPLPPPRPTTTTSPISEDPPPSKPHFQLARVRRRARPTTTTATPSSPSSPQPSSPILTSQDASSAEDHQDDDDDDDDYSAYCRALLRRKSDCEMVAPAPQMPIVELSKMRGRYALKIHRRHSVPSSSSSVPSTHTAAPVASVPPTPATVAVAAADSATVTETPGTSARRRAHTPTTPTHLPDFPSVSIPANSSKRHATVVIQEVPFSDARYNRMLGVVVLPPLQIAQDLACMYGRDVEDCKVALYRRGTTSGRRADRKRPRSGHVLYGSRGVALQRMPKVQNVPFLKQVDGHGAALDGGARATRSGGRGRRTPSGVDDGAASWVIASADACSSILTKKARTGAAPYGNNNNGNCNQVGNGTKLLVANHRVLFVKHGERKGWVVCKKCTTSVWPPNCAKHAAHCAKK